MYKRLFWVRAAEDGSQEVPLMRRLRIAALCIYSKCSHWANAYVRKHILLNVMIFLRIKARP